MPLGKESLLISTASCLYSTTTWYFGPKYSEQRQRYSFCFIQISISCITILLLFCLLLMHIQAVVPFREIQDITLLEKNKSSVLLKFTAKHSYLFELRNVKVIDLILICTHSTIYYHFPFSFVLYLHFLTSLNLYLYLPIFQEIDDVVNTIKNAWQTCKTSSDQNEFEINEKLIEGGIDLNSEDSSDNTNNNTDELSMQDWQVISTNLSSIHLSSIHLSISIFGYSFFYIFRLFWVVQQ